VFEETEMGTKGSLPFVTFANAKMRIRAFKINDSENFTTLNSIKKIIYKRERIVILPGDGIKSTEVDTEANVASLLLDEEDGGAGRGSRTADVTPL
jgi:hypothetical protein